MSDGNPDSRERPNPIVRPLAPTQRASRVLAVLWALLIAAFLLLPLPPEQEDYLPGWLARSLGPWSDDLVHGGLFFGFAYLLLGAMGARHHRKTLAFLVAVGYGALTEWLQPRVSGRTGEWTDLLADALGAFAGVLAVAAFERVKAQRERSSPPQPS
jgi:VanZ family protein